MAANLADLAQFSKRQLGLVTNAQLKGMGWSKDRIKWVATRGLIVVVRPHVWRVATVPVSWEQARLAAALAGGKGSVLSYTTSGAVWTLRHCGRDRAGIYLCGPERITLKGVTFHLAELTSEETTTKGFLPVMTAERTIVDLASGMALAGKQLGECVDDALRRGIVDLARLRRSVDMLRRRHERHLNRIEEVLAPRIPGYRPDDSDFETRMNALWDQLGLPPARRQFPVRIDGHPYRLDRALVAEKIAIEWDSDRFHSYPSDRDHDSNRRARLVAAGWLVIPVTANTTPELLANAVQRACHDRATARQRR
ncbi:MAG: hypothetical protein ACRDZ8_08990 [Acidimicrobiales bacterium]